MKVNRLLLVGFLSILGMQSASATIFDVINLDSEQRDKLVNIHLIFKDAAGNMGSCETYDMQYQEKKRLDSSTSLVPDSFPIDFDTAKLDRIELYYFYGQYNDTEPLNWDNPTWTRKINWKWNSEEISDRRRWMWWQIFFLGRLNIPASTSSMLDTVQIRIHSNGKCDIIQGGTMKTLQGRLNKRHAEDV